MPIETGSCVFPGDLITELSSIKNLIVIGPGLRRSEENANALMVTTTGRLCFKPPNFYWIEGKQRRYIPKKGDVVVGTVTKKGGDVLKVDIGSGELASLSMFAFEGATKKLRPDVQIGDVIYAKLVSAHREMEPELVCVDSYFKAGKLGVLSSDGFVINVIPNTAHRLLEPGSTLLATLGKKFPYEVAVGINGKIWINAKSVGNVKIIMEALKAYQHVT